MNCPNCENNTFYILANDYIKCKKCAKKLSLKKLEKDKLIIEKFCEDKNALETAKSISEGRVIVVVSPSFTVLFGNAKVPLMRNSCQMSYPSLSGPPS